MMCDVSLFFHPGVNEKITLVQNKQYGSTPEYLYQYQVLPIGYRTEDSLPNR